MLTGTGSTREKLLRAALTLVARDGFPAATTAAIADAAGVAEGTLYRHFPSKDDLLIEVYRALKAEILAAVRTDEPASAPPEDQLMRFWRSAFDAYRVDRDAFMFGQRFAESELAKREGGEAAERFRSALEAIHAAGLARGRFKPAPIELLASLFWAPIGHMLKQEIAGRQWTDQELDLAARSIAASWGA